MSKKAIFDHNKAKSILKERGVDISVVKTSNDFNVHQNNINKWKKGVNGNYASFLLDFCNKHKLTIQEVITIKEE